MFNRFVTLTAAAVVTLSAGSAWAQLGKPTEKKGALRVGSAAPELSIDKWVKGDAVKKFEDGKVYVVEFWATWCGPCIESIPHLTQLQKANKDVVFMGVAASEHADSTEKALKGVEAFVKKQGTKMEYRVAFDGDETMSKEWMRAAGQNGIPCAFIVGADHKIAWIGHPAAMEEPLKTAVKKEKKEEPKKGAMAFPTFEPANTAFAYQEGAKQEAKKDAKKDDAKKDEAPAAPAVTLLPGVKAPAIQTGKFAKGEPITTFEKGRIYVVEFWATWCGPCMKAIPHLTELQKEYKDKVTMLGVSVWESDQSKVQPFVTKKGDEMGYTVAHDDVPALPEDIKAGTGPAQQFYVKNGKMSQTWMAAAGRDGIPSSFIINGEGTVAWIGSPFEIDEPLKQIVEGKFDVAKFAAKYKADIENEKAMMAAQQTINKFMRAVRGNDAAKTTELGNELVEKFGTNPMLMNQIAWSIVDPKSPVEKRDVELALRAALKAADASEHKDAAILDTLARVYFTKGDVDKAIEIETKAVGLASGEMKDELQEALDEFKAKKGK